MLWNIILLLFMIVLLLIGIGHTFLLWKIINKLQRHSSEEERQREVHIDMHWHIPEDINRIIPEKVECNVQGVITQNAVYKEIREKGLPDSSNADNGRKQNITTAIKMDANNSRENSLIEEKKKNKGDGIGGQDVSEGLNQNDKSHGQVLDIRLGIAHSVGFNQLGNQVQYVEDPNGILQAYKLVGSKYGVRIYSDSIGQKEYQQYALRDCFDFTPEVESGKYYKIIRISRPCLMVKRDAGYCVDSRGRVQIEEIPNQ